MYIRPKKIKGYHYAYLVKSYRSKRPKKKRQKVIKYLGRIIESKKIKDLTFEEFLKKDPEKYFKKSELKEILREILTFELINHGFKKKGELYVCNECFVNLGKKKIYSNETGKDISISMAEKLPPKWYPPCFLANASVSLLTCFDLSFIYPPSGYWKSISGLSVLFGKSSPFTGKLSSVSHTSSTKSFLTKPSSINGGKRYSSTFISDKELFACI